MRKKYVFSIILLALIACFTIYFLLFSSNIEENPEISDNPGKSISYLSEEDEKSVLKVFNFDQEKIKKIYKLNPEEDIYSSSFYNTKENLSVISTQQSDPYGYNFFLQDAQKIKKIGFINQSVQDVIVNKDFLYVIVYSVDKTSGVQLRKYKLTDLKKPLKAWDIKGDPERMVLDYKNDDVYILMANDSTFLYRLDNKTNHLDKKELFDKEFDLDATINSDKLWLLLREELSDRNTKNQQKIEKTSLVVYDLNTDKKLKTITTKFQPKFIQFVHEKIYVISGTSNNSYLEIYNTNNNNPKLKKVINLKADTINGFNKGKYIFSNNGIFKIENNSVRLISKDSVSPKTDLIMH